MKSGVYVLHPGDPEFSRCFDTMAMARQHAVTDDTIVSIGDGGEELGRWIKRADGCLVATARTLQKPKAHHPWREPRYRDTRGTPPPSGRGPDGKPMKPDNSAAGDPHPSGPGTPAAGTARTDASTSDR